jgi:branched-subunit amino acid aminotransferase/4-amino-4-deoxychorismate lyase
VPLIVDSWLVEDGLVLGLDLHEERFRRSCAELLPAVERDALDRLFAAARTSVPDEGLWFPRVEAYAEPHGALGLRMRRAPARTASISLWVPSQPDPRARPTVKGPDLAVLAALREQARSLGAEDVLLRTVDGAVLEAGHSALLWWREDTLCAPSEESAVLPSVTMTFVTAIAQTLGVRVQRERCSVEELLGLPAWSLNALHGIRPVSRWVGPDGPRLAAAGGQDAEEWQAMLQERRLPIALGQGERAGGQAS